MTGRFIRAEVEKNVATLTITRPESLNALNGEVLSELERVLSWVGDDEDIRAVIITGAGEKSFVAGGDIKEMASLSPHEAHQFALSGQRILLALQGMAKPVIAAVNGYALGGGLELALACDFIYASTTARIGLPEVTLGVIPGFGGTQNLARVIGKARANELVFSGRIISAEKACSWGIVNEVFPPEDLLPKAREVAAAMARVGPLGVAFAKDAIATGLDMSKKEGLRYEASLFGVLFSTRDQREGMAAFIEKRKAAFEGS